MVNASKVVKVGKCKVKVLEYLRCLKASYREVRNDSRNKNGKCVIFSPHGILISEFRILTLISGVLIS